MDMSYGEDPPDEPSMPWAEIPALSRDIDWASIKKLPLDPQAEMSPETWARLVNAIESFNVIDGFEGGGYADARLGTEGGDYDALVEYPFDPSDSVINLHFARWLGGDNAIDGRSVSHVDIDLRRPGVVLARDTEVSYPDRYSAGTSFEGQVIKKEEYPTAYPSTFGDTIGYVERNYVVNERGAQSIAGLLEQARRVSDEAADKAFHAVLESLEPGLREACERYFIARKSLVFDPEKEFRVEYQVINDPYRHFGDALFANLPGRIELYRINRQPSEDKSRRWLRAVWHKEEFPDDTRINEVEPSEVEELTVKEALAHLPDGPAQDYIKKVEGRWLINTRLLMMRDSGGRRGVSHEREPEVRREYQERYQQYQELFPEDDLIKEYGLTRELPE